MTTDWIYRMFIFTTVENADNDNSIWTLIAPGGDGEYYTFVMPYIEQRVKYSENWYGNILLFLRRMVGIKDRYIVNEPVTHYGANTAATQAMLEMINAMIDNGCLDVAYYLFDHDSDILMAQRNGSAALHQPFTWEDALEDQDLLEGTEA